jgi:hypothetical protein
MVRKFICPVIGYLMLAASAHSETIGIVMMHGKHGTPIQLQQLAETVSNAGFWPSDPKCVGRQRAFTIELISSALLTSMRLQRA